MEKYKGLQEITKEIMHADLEHIAIHYEDDHCIIIDVEYKDDVYIYLYELEIDKTTHEITFRKHDCIGHGAETHLLRNIQYEKAIESYLYNEKR